MRQGSRRRSRSQESRQGAAVAAKNFDKRITQPTIAAKRGRQRGGGNGERGERSICLQVQPFCSTNFENQKRNWQNKGKKGKNEAEGGKEQQREGESERERERKGGVGSVGGRASLGMTDCLHCLWIANVATANDACSSSSAGTAEPASPSLLWGTQRGQGRESCAVAPTDWPAWTPFRISAQSETAQWNAASASSAAKHLFPLPSTLRLLLRLLLLCCCRSLCRCLCPQRRFRTSPKPVAAAAARPCQKLVALL